MRGRLIQRVLTGAWRAVPPPLELQPDELEEIVPTLVDTWTPALAWWRLRHTDLGECRGAATLHDAFRHYRLRAAVADGEIAQIVTRLRQAGVVPIFAKGRIVARLYPEVGVRPFVDVDLFVRPAQYRAAAAALAAGLDVPPESVDLHSGIAELDDRDLDDIYQRTRPMTIGGVEARILGPEDELRFLCLHLVGHFLRWPISLCDVGAALESLPAGFDWAYCLDGEARRSRWTACALLLAHRLLGARIDHLPCAAATSRVPRWLAPDILHGWGAARMPLVAMAASRHNPRDLFTAVLSRWPSGTEATIRLDGSLNNLPRLPLQLRLFLQRALRFQARAVSAVFSRVTRLRSPGSHIESGKRGR